MFTKKGFVPDAMYVNAAANVTLALASSEPPILVHFIPMRARTAPQKPKITETTARALLTWRKLTNQRERDIVNDPAVTWNHEIMQIFPHQAGPSWRGSIYSQILLWCLRHSPSRGWNSNHRRWEPQTHFLRRPSTQWPEWNNQNPATQTGHKATDLHVHHHRSLPHAAGLMSRERKCVEKSYGESGACISERLQVNNEMRLNSDVGLLLFLEPSFCSSQLETGKTTWFDLISSFSLPEGIPC